MSLYERAHFGIIRLVHETLYRFEVDPYDWLRATGVAAGQRVLEVGCGPGFFTLPAAELVGGEGRITAFDNNPAAVDYVRRKVQRSAARNVDVVQGDAVHTDLPDRSQDVVFLYGVIHALWGQVDQVAAEANRILKPDGILSVSGSQATRERMIAEAARSGLFRLSDQTAHVVNFRSLPGKATAL
jgi:ubiquinone/menaquinone biosynthesis C-methylase UbiE